MHQENSVLNGHHNLDDGEAAGLPFQLTPEAAEFVGNVEAEIASLGAQAPLCRAVVERELARIKRGELTHQEYFTTHQDAPEKVAEKAPSSSREPPTAEEVGISGDRKEAQPTENGPVFASPAEVQEGLALIMTTLRKIAPVSNLIQLLSSGDTSTPLIGPPPGPGVPLPSSSLSVDTGGTQPRPASPVIQSSEEVAQVQERSPSHEPSALDRPQTTQPAYESPSPSAPTSTSSSTSFVVGSKLSPSGSRRKRQLNDCSEPEPPELMVPQELVQFRDLVGETSTRGSKRRSDLRDSVSPEFSLDTRALGKKATPVVSTKRTEAVSAGKKMSPATLTPKVFKKNLPKPSPKTTPNSAKPRKSTGSSAKAMKDEPSTTAIEEQEEKFEVDKIIASRKKASGKVVFLVQWKGYGPEENSWESATHMNEAKDAVRDFTLEFGNASSKTPHVYSEAGLAWQTANPTMKPY